MSYKIYASQDYVNEKDSASLAEAKQYTDDKLGTKLGKTENAASATKLKTPRKIKLSGGINAEANFDGSNDANITVNEISEAYLQWGGKNISGGVTPIDAAMSDEMRPNRLAFMHPDDIVVEYSTDSGETWLDYGMSDTEKQSLVTYGSNIKVGKSDVGAVSNQARVTITAESNHSLYFLCQKILINISTDGAIGCQVRVETSKIGSVDTFAELITVPVSGWSGWNSIPTWFAFGGGPNQTGQVKKIRMTFFCTGVNEAYSSTMRIMKIRMHGATAWAAPSTMADRGVIYTSDIYKNATFPADLKGKKLYEDGKALNTVYASKSELQTLQNSIESALDNIISIQNDLIGGGNS